MTKQNKAWTDKDLRDPGSWDEPLTEDEIAWLRDRDRHADIRANAEEHGGDTEELENPETDAARSPQVKSALDPTQATTVVTEVLPQEVTIEDDYEDWKVAELRAECDKRTPVVEYTTMDKKPDLVAKLRAWDAEYPDAAVE